MHPAEVVAVLHGQRVGFSGHQALDGLRDFGHDFGHVEILGVHVHLAGLDLGHVEHVVDE
jgi:hypothetical protein